MVTACKNYITDYGMSRIWDQSYKTLIDKLQVSVKLYKEYQTCFHKAKKKIEAIPEERPFDFSEMYIFGKFDAFCKRIDKVRTALTVQIQKPVLYSLTKKFHVNFLVVASCI